MDNFPQSIQANNGEHIYIFYGIHSPLSAIYPASFTVDGVEFGTAQQHFYWQKATHFGDMETAIKIRATDIQYVQRDLARKIKNYDHQEWVRVSDTVNFIIPISFIPQTMFNASWNKFSQNKELAKYLLNTGDHRLADCQESDRYWGNGVNIRDTQLLKNPDLWPGKNKTGYVLAAVRESLRQQQQWQLQQALYKWE